MPTLRFHAGTLVLEDVTPDQVPPGFRWDDRVGAARGPGWLYRDTVLDMVAAGSPFDDQARAWERLPQMRLLLERTPRPYQQEALDAWEAGQRRGAVILPTGAGKTYVALMAMARAQRPTLIVAPTLDLVGQWYDIVKAAFGMPVGILGGGHHEIETLTVTTYDSAYLHLARYGDRFGLLVFDEVHHLPAPGYLTSAESALAPFRLGLTATWEREDDRQDELDLVLGPVLYRKEITELRGEYLADYETVKLEVHLSPSERERYDAARGQYLAFVRHNRISMSGPNGWQNFLMVAARSREGRAAHKAYMESKAIAHGTEGKLDALARILEEEWGRPTIVFTHDNATAYRISREFLVPCITHQTDVKERRALLDAFGEGTIKTLATSKVLNEGVDLPGAEVAIVLSGSGTVREHVQRLGRILRKTPDKQAVLYEIVAAGTSEERTSSRRRKHSAYR